MKKIIWFLIFGAIFVLLGGAGVLLYINLNKDLDVNITVTNGGKVNAIYGDLELPVLSGDGDKIKVKYRDTIELEAVAESNNFVFAHFDINGERNTNSKIEIKVTKDLNVKATFTQKVFNVTLKASGAEDKIVSVPYGTNLLTRLQSEVAIADTGYRNVFKIGSEEVTADTILAVDTIITHTVELIDYSISYELNGGILASANPSTYNVTTETFTLNNPTRNGFTFNGWKKNEEATVSKDVTIEVGSTGNLTFTATWLEHASVPTANANVYNASEQTVTWQNYDTDKLEMSGTTTATDAGTYTTTFTPKLGYCWSDGSTEAKSIEWTISSKNLDDSLTYEYTSNFEYTGNSIEPTVVVKIGDNVVSNDNYTMTYSNNTDLGTATITITGKNNLASSIDLHFTITKSFESSDITLTLDRSDSNYDYTAESITAIPTVKDKGVTLTKDVDYTVTGDSATEAGTYTLTVTGKGKYTGTKTIEWTITKTPIEISFNNNLPTDITESIGDFSAQTVYKYDTYGALPTPKLLQYRFDGWFTSPVDGEKVESTTTVAANATAHTLYAHWTMQYVQIKLQYKYSHNESVEMSINNGYDGYNLSELYVDILADEGQEKIYTKNASTNELEEWGLLSTWVDAIYDKVFAERVVSAVGSYPINSAEHLLSEIKLIANKKCNCSYIFYYTDNYNEVVE